MTDRYPEPDPGRYPVWPSGTWQRALINQVAGLRSDPETVRALARHDAEHGAPGVREAIRQAAEYDRRLRADLAPVLRSSLDVPVMDLDLFAMAVEDAPGWAGRGDDVRAAVLQQHPLTDSSLAGRTTGTSGQGALVRYWTGTAHLVATSAAAVRRWTSGKCPVDPLDPPVRVLRSVTREAGKIAPPPAPSSGAEDVPTDTAPVRVAEVVPLRSPGVSLSPQERAAAFTKAVDLRRAGRSLAQIAQSVGVDRSTVRRWVREHEDTTPVVS